MEGTYFINNQKCNHNFKTANLCDQQSQNQTKKCSDKYLSGGNNQQIKNKQDIGNLMQIEECNSHIYRIINDFFINFDILANSYPKLYPHLVILNYKTVINFKNQQSLIVLAQAIMKCIFSIIWHCPPQNLCPRIPNRLNYLLWINKYIPIKIQNVIDIGTGASLIYPLLGWSVFKWKFVAIENNEKSVQHANYLIKQNKLQDVIKVIKGNLNEDIFNISDQIKRNNIEYQQEHSKIIQLKYFDIFDIVICNPPFYDCQISQDEEQVKYQLEQQQKVIKIKSNEDKQQQQFLRDYNRKSGWKSPLGTMLRQQFSVEGGEQSFKYVSKTSQQPENTSNSHHPQISIRYFSCLLGRQSTFSYIKNFLQYQLKYGVLQIYRLGQIRQGHNTRFIVMWRPKSYLIK